MALVLFIYTFAHACAFVETQLTQAFHCPGISTLTASGVNRADTPLCPRCIAAGVTMEQWENAAKVALKERYSNLRAPESSTEVERLTAHGRVDSVRVSRFWEPARGECVLKQ